MDLKKDGSKYSCGVSIDGGRSSSRAFHIWSDRLLPRQIWRFAAFDFTGYCDDGLAMYNMPFNWVAFVIGLWSLSACQKRKRSALLIAMDYSTSLLLVEIWRSGLLGLCSHKNLWYSERGTRHGQNFGSISSMNLWKKKTFRNWATNGRAMVENSH